MLISNSYSTNSNRDCFLSTECVYVGLVSTSQKFLAHNNVALVKTRAYKTMCMGKWIHSSESSFWLKNVINIIYLVIPFKCDLNPAVSIITV
jgi:hypothetical protein